MIGAGDSVVAYTEVTQLSVPRKANRQQFFCCARNVVGMWLADYAANPYGMTD